MRRERSDGNGAGNSATPRANADCLFTNRKFENARSRGDEARSEELADGRKRQREREKYKLSRLERGRDRERETNARGGGNIVGYYEFAIFRGASSLARAAR